ncbi:serine hydrolase domain-containing protein [Hyphobacterium marinum]|uniref:Serine hydrolase domain-containing protein n=1 Tax=Hyphobacterium marinum TaxID=3116574 RepID=A0ABU7LXN8_9PROT|nr:serine hydrolase domain-containing protein [Hyphobacterium sp. Y6023]MEE2566321.1 serine hydrolase domain-containing protein [Hyphobacterium sp. Y6023]
MRKLDWIRLAVGLAAVLVLVVTFAGRRAYESLDPEAPPDRVAAQLDAVLSRAMDRYSISGAVAGAIHDAEIIWSTRRGFRTAEGDPVTGHTAFNLGSISKPLTVWTILSLVYHGEIDLDRPVGDYLTRYDIPAGEFDPSGVTIRRLLRHTAGTNIQGYGGYGAHEHQPVDALDLTENFERVGIVREPGTARRYSGGGYVLLQMMAEDVTGQSFDALARVRVLEPLGMTNSGFDPARLDEVSDSFAYYGNRIETLRDVALAAAGGYASADDLERFLLAHLGGQTILSAAMIETAFAPTNPDPAFAMSYTRWRTPSGWLFGHGGNNSTWHGQIYVRPETGDGFYFLTNTTGGAQLDLDLSCAWLSMMESADADRACADALSVARSVGWWAAGFALAALALVYWLAAGIVCGRRVLALRPSGRSRLRLVGRLFVAILAAVLCVGAVWIFYTNSVIWRTETILIDEIPLDEIEGLALSVTSAFAVLFLSLWSSPVRGR